MPRSNSRKPTRSSAVRSPAASPRPRVVRNRIHALPARSPAVRRPSPPALPARNRPVLPALSLVAKLRRLAAQHHQSPAAISRTRAPLALARAPPARPSWIRKPLKNLSLRSRRPMRERKLDLFLLVLHPSRSNAAQRSLAALNLSHAVPSQSRAAPSQSQPALSQKHAALSQSHVAKSLRHAALSLNLAPRSQNAPRAPSRAARSQNHAVTSLSLAALRRAPAALPQPQWPAAETAWLTLRKLLLPATELTARSGTSCNSSKSLTRSTNSQTSRTKYLRTTST
jgi:hypothetical protein